MKVLEFTAAVVRLKLKSPTTREALSWALLAPDDSLRPDLSQAWVQSSDQPNVALAELISNPKVMRRDIIAVVHKQRLYNELGLDFLLSQLSSSDSWASIEAIDTFGSAGQAAFNYVDVLASRLRDAEQAKPDDDSETQEELLISLKVALYRITYDRAYVFDLLHRPLKDSRDRYSLGMTVGRLGEAVQQWPDVVLENLNSIVDTRHEELDCKGFDYELWMDFALETKSAACLNRIEDLTSHRDAFIREHAQQALKRDASELVDEP